MRTDRLLIVSLLATAFAAMTAAPGPQHYSFFNRDRARIRAAAFLDTPAIAGAQLKYTWNELEPKPDTYAFAPVLADLAFLEAHHKRLVIPLQDASFDERVNVPNYLREDSSCHGGAARKYEAESGSDTVARFEGWVARRWGPAVQLRSAKLLRALGGQVGMGIEALVLPWLHEQPAAAARH